MIGIFATGTRALWLRVPKILRYAQDVLVLIGRLYLDRPGYWAGFYPFSKISSIPFFLTRHQLFLMGICFMRPSG